MIAIASALPSAASKKVQPLREKGRTEYSPSMKNEPCIKFGMRISPKIRENPSQRLIGVVYAAAYCTRFFAGG